MPIEARLILMTTTQQHTISLTNPTTNDYLMIRVRPDSTDARCSNSKGERWTEDREVARRRIRGLKARGWHASN